MVGKKSGASGEMLRKEGLARFNNNMGLTSWPQVPPINQKNYYTEYLKRDDQILAYRLQNEENRNRMTKSAKDRDRALAMAKTELPLPEPELDADGDTGEGANGESAEELVGSKTIVMHVGSQNLRIGLASDALPKTTPMVIARKSHENEAEEGGGEPKPKRLKLDGGQFMEPEKMFGPEFASQYTTMSAELKAHMRANKRRTLPNSKEMVVNYNRRTVPETISEHNDPMRIEWTEIPSDPEEAPEYLTGEAALRIPDYSKPRYKLFWPIRHGWLNERDYDNKTLLFLDIALILEDAMKTQLNLTGKKDWSQYSCVFVIPDLYERVYVTQILEMLMREFGFARVCFVQESLSGTFGAGYTSACVVDIGAQKTSICCVEEGMCIENSRVNLKYGGADVTETFIKMMLFDHFPYDEINLNRRYDFLLAEELKRNVCTLNESNVSVHVFDFHLRASGQDTRKYTFKAYDEVILAPMGLFQPEIFDVSQKLKGRRKLISRSYDLYDGQPNDPASAAQSDLLAAIAPPLPANNTGTSQTNFAEVQSTPSRSQAINAISRLQDLEATPRSSVASSPAPDAVSTPQQGGSGTPAPASQAPAAASSPRRPTVEERDDVLPIFPLDNAIFTAISGFARVDERKFTDFLGGVLVIGGGSLTSGFHSFLEERIQLRRPEFASYVMVGSPPRELDPQVVVWKGASVFAKLDATNDSWISRLEVTIFPGLGACCPVAAMSKTKDGHSGESYHQEYIASLRYRNDLPPPEMPPKFLEIPHEGLERFLTPGFASNMARREEPNIDVDAEGGMPIDLVGIPGLHLGDESAIMAPENPLPVDPADLPLLMTLDQLRNPAPKNSNVSFLRRTQYIAAGVAARGVDGNLKAAPLMAPSSVKSSPAAAKAAKLSRDDPIHVKKYIQKGFDIAYPESKHKGEDTPSRIKGLPATKAEIDAWANPTHPDNPKLKPVGFFPIIPDLGGFPDPGGFVQFKFDKAPIQAAQGRRDERMDVGILVPSAPEERVCQEHASKTALHKANPSLYPDPGPIPWDYDLFLPERQGTAPQIKNSLNVCNSHRDDAENYTHEATGSDETPLKYHRYDRIRTYATSLQQLNPEQKYKDVALVLFDPAEAAAEESTYKSSSTTTIPHRLKQKAAYYYPILGKTRLKPERARTIAQAGLAPTRPKAKEEQVHQIQVVVRDPDEAEEYKRASHRAQVDSRFAKTLAAPPPPPEEEGASEQDVDEAGKDEVLAEGVAGGRREEGRDENDAGVDEETDGERRRGSVDEDEEMVDS
ncbi:hypothetical protein BDDG_11715 [Blastomyces dermatitidis ATCC 18188]|uniref:Uncharacterized protein n=1 Tax=Ajellomyces dermatitidis (strain ATCC 18188 / CBS 674.68) TaxID=653446 RepID=A0A0J9EK59_AJEDA|nr:hypothetical protein BDDG_11715 [Blastomyces dermatitidis ATCC 18188]